MSAGCVLLLLSALCCVLAGGPELWRTPRHRNPYIFTTLQSEPFLMRSNPNSTQDDHYTGFIPDMLLELCRMRALPCDYTFSLVEDGRIGFMDMERGRWVGMIGELITYVDTREQGREWAHMAAAPIPVTRERSEVVRFSDVWLNFSLAAVTRRANGVTNLTDVMKSGSNVTVGCVEDGETLRALQRADTYSHLLNVIESNPDSKVTSVTDGLERSLMGNYTFITESTTAEYLTNKHCELHVIDEFLPQEGYAFAVSNFEASLLADLNEGIRQMLTNGTLDNLRARWFQPPCNVIVSSQHKITAAFHSYVMISVLLLTS